MAVRNPMSSQEPVHVQPDIPRGRFLGAATIGGVRGIWLHGDILVRLLTSLPIRRVGTGWRKR